LQKSASTFTFDPLFDAFRYINGSNSDFGRSIYAAKPDIVKVLETSILSKSGDSKEQNNAVEGCLEMEGLPLNE
jgi:hypothetical protein